MKYGSLFSGIEAASLAWRPLGWSCAWVAEIDPFACAVLKHHYPDVPNLGDVTKVDWDAVEPVDVIVGGSPCQSFSVAGKRLGLDDPRGNLALVYLDVVRRVRPRWMVFENVPGLLSSDEGRDFGTFLGLLGKCGYGFAYRILDAQFGGVPQRRRRLWVVGCLGDWRPAAAVLFDEQSLHGDPPPGRQTGQGAARPITPGSPGGSDYRNDADTADNLITGTLPAAGGTERKHGHGWGQQEWENGFIQPVAFGGNNTAGPIEVATACNAHGGPHGRLDFESETFITHSLTSDNAGRAQEDGTGRGVPLVPVTGRNGDPGMSEASTTTVVMEPQAFTVSEQANAFAWERPVYPSLQAHPQSESSNIQQGIRSTSGVRRLLPVETERLMAMPDNYTLVPYRGKPAADGPRYKAIGNSMVVTEIRWLGERIEAVIRAAPASTMPRS